MVCMKKTFSCTKMILTLETSVRKRETKKMVIWASISNQIQFKVWMKKSLALPLLKVTFKDRNGYINGYEFCKFAKS